MNMPSSGIVETSAEDVPWERWRGPRFIDSSRTLRVLAIHILAFWTIDTALGMLLAGERVAQDPYSSASLVLHILIGLLMAGMGAYAVIVSLRSPGWRIRAASGLTLASITGAAFMYGEGTALMGLKVVLGGIALIGTVLLLAWTRPHIRRWDDA